LLFKSKWDTLSVLNIANEKYFVFKNRGAAPLNLYFLFVFCEIPQIYNLDRCFGLRVVVQ
jgi:hypothetical protein